MHSPLAKNSIYSEILNPPQPKVLKSGCEHSNDHISTVPTPNVNMLQIECRGQPDLPSLQNSIEEKVYVPSYDLRKTAKKTQAQICANSRSFKGQYSQLAPPKNPKQFPDAIQPSSNISTKLQHLIFSSYLAKNSAVLLHYVCANKKKPSPQK